MDFMGKELSVVLPSYNTKDLARNVSEIKKEVEKITKDYEIIVVNDGSTKEWGKELEKLQDMKKINILSYEENEGKGYALKKGGIKAMGEKVVFLDSDLDIHPKQIELFLKELENFDVVIGSKRHPQSRLRYPLFRRFMSSTYQIINAVLFNLNVKDTQVGIKGFRREVLGDNLGKLVIKRYAFDLELLVVLNKFGYRIKEAPVEIDYKFGSKINPRAVINMLIDTAAIFYRLKFVRHYDK